MKRGTFSFEGGVTNVVEQITGTPAEPFEATARRYATLPFARQLGPLFFVLFVTRFQIMPEERAMQFKFGRQYKKSRREDSHCVPS